MWASAGIVFVVVNVVEDDIDRGGEMCNQERQQRRLVGSMW